MASKQPDVVFDGVSIVLGMTPRNHTYMVTRSIEVGNVTILDGVTLRAGRSK